MYNNPNYRLDRRNKTGGASMDVIGKKKKKCRLVFI